MNSYNTNIFPPLSIKVISMGTTEVMKELTHLDAHQKADLP